MTAPATIRQQPKKARKPAVRICDRMRAAIEAITGAGLIPEITMQGDTIKITAREPDQSTGNDAAALDEKMAKAFGSSGCAA